MMATERLTCWMHAQLKVEHRARTPSVVRTETKTAHLTVEMPSQWTLLNKPTWTKTDSEITPRETSLMLALLHMGVQHETTSLGVRMLTATAGPIVQTPSQETFLNGRTVMAMDTVTRSLDSKETLVPMCMETAPNRLGCPDEDKDGWSDAGDAFPTDSHNGQTLMRTALVTTKVGTFRCFPKRCNAMA